MKNFATLNFILIFLLISGCAYYSRTIVYMKAEEASYPIGISPVRLVNGEINIYREMQTGGITGHGLQTNSTK